MINTYVVFSEGLVIEQQITLPQGHNFRSKEIRTRNLIHVVEGLGS